MNILHLAIAIILLPSSVLALDNDCTTQIITLEKTISETMKLEDLRSVADWIRMKGNWPSKVSEDMVEKRLAHWVNNHGTRSGIYALLSKIGEMKDVVEILKPLMNKENTMLKKLAEWIVENNSCPNSRSENKIERKWAEWVHHNGGQRGVYAAFLKMRELKEISEAIEILRPLMNKRNIKLKALAQWIRENNHWPSAKSTDATERRWARWIGKKGTVDSVYAELRQIPEAADVTRSFNIMIKFAPMELLFDRFGADLGWSVDDLSRRQQIQLLKYIKKNGGRTSVYLAMLGSERIAYFLTKINLQPQIVDPLELISLWTLRNKNRRADQSSRDAVEAYIANLVIKAGGWDSVNSRLKSKLSEMESRYLKLDTASYGDIIDILDLASRMREIATVVNDNNASRFRFYESKYVQKLLSLYKPYMRYLAGKYARGDKIRHRELLAVCRDALFDAKDRAIPFPDFSFRFYVERYMKGYVIKFLKREISQSNTRQALSEERGNDNYVWTGKRNGMTYQQQSTKVLNVLDDDTMH